LTEEELKRNLSKNIVFLRKENGLTQAELAQRLNYSDKSISKWERGDGVPDVLVLQQIAETYGVTLNDLISEKTPKPIGKKPHLTNRIIIPLLSVGLVFLVASVIFFSIRFAGVNESKTWFVFLYAIPVACIPLIVFSALWFRNLARCLSVSGLIWSFTLCLKVSIPNDNMKFIFITAAILQLLVVLWFFMRYRAAKREEKAAASE